MSKSKKVLVPNSPEFARLSKYDQKTILVRRSEAQGRALRVVATPEEKPERLFWGSTRNENLALFLWRKRQPLSLGVVSGRMG